MRRNEETVDVEAVPIGADGAQLLREGAALVKLENDTQMAIAIQRPRNEAMVLKKAVEELGIYREAAEEAIYCKPVGKDQTGEMQFAEGLSVRAAEALALRWGNNAFGAEILADDGETLSGVAVWLDYETNNRRTFPFKVSRKYKGRGGTMRRHAEDRFYDLVVPAKLSRVLRETILRSLPAGLKKAYEREARRIMSEKGAGEAARIVKAFALYGVTQTEIEAMIGKPRAGWDGDDIATLVGLGNAIKSGSTTVEQAFGREPSPEENGGRGPVTTDDVFKGAPKGFNDPEAETVERPTIPPATVGTTDEAAEMRPAPTPEDNAAEDARLEALSMLHEVMTAKGVSQRDETAFLQLMAGANSIKSLTKEQAEECIVKLEDFSTARKLGAWVKQETARRKNGPPPGTLFKD